jgi:hypothetical protein
MSILKYEVKTMWELWPIVLIGAIVAYAVLRYRETFVVKYGNPFDNEDLLSFDPAAKGTRLFAITPDTCPSDRSELQDGLCYEPCAPGYRGVGPVCWAETRNIGVGTLAKLTSCKDMGLGTDYRDDPLTCMKDLKCSTYCDDNWDWSDGGFCHTKCEGPDLKGKTLSCPGDQAAFFSFFTGILSGTTERINPADYTDLVDGLCYKPCPKDKPVHVPLMPYLCYRPRDPKTGVSYGRGAGTVPPIFHFGA